MMSKQHLYSAMPFFLLFIAGTVDAIGFIYFKNDVFVSFMSGNTTHVGIMLTSDDMSQAWKYVVIILLFVFGAGVGEVIAVRNKLFYPCIIMLVVAVMLTIAILVESIVNAIVVSYFLAFAMGIQNIALRSTIEKSTPLTYVTGFLINTGRSLAMFLMGRGQLSTFLYFVLMWLSIFSGVIVGTLIVNSFYHYALLLSIILCLSAALSLYWIHEMFDE